MPMGCGCTARGCGCLIISGGVIQYGAPSVSHNARLCGRHPFAATLAAQHYKSAGYNGVSLFAMNV